MMIWTAQLIDGPLEGRTVGLDDEDGTGEPPADISVDGHEYLFCGWSGDTPRYRFDFYPATGPDHALVRHLRAPGGEPQD